MVAFKQQYIRSAHSLIRARISRYRPASPRRPISGDRYIIFCTLRAFCGGSRVRPSASHSVAFFLLEKRQRTTKSRTWLNERTIFQRMARLYIRLFLFLSLSLSIAFFSLFYSIIPLFQIRLCNSRRIYIRHPDRVLILLYMRNLRANYDTSIVFKNDRFDLFPHGFSKLFSLPAYLTLV